jgi:hypothetical protein
VLLEKNGPIVSEMKKYHKDSRRKEVLKKYKEVQRSKINWIGYIAVVNVI